MSRWLVAMPFLALNPTQKSEIVAYVCNELLQNKAVVRQIEDSLDRHNGLKTEKWKLDTRIRKLRMSVARKRIYSAAMRSMEHRGGEDSNMSSVSSCHGGEHDKTETKKEKEEEKLEEEEEEEDNESGNDSENNLEEIPDEEDDKRLNADEASKTLDILQRQMDQVRQDLFETAQQVRGFNCGQDRYQDHVGAASRRGSLPGGPLVLRLHGASTLPLTLPTAGPKAGLSQEEVEERLAVAKEEKERQEEEEEKAKMEVKEEVKEEVVEVKSEVKEEKEVVEEGESVEVGDVKAPVSLLEVKKEGQVKDEVKEEEDSCGVPDIPARGARRGEESREEGKAPLGQNGVLDTKDVSGSLLGDLYPPLLGSSLGPYLVNGLKEGTPLPASTGEGIDPTLLALGLGLVPGQYLRPEHVAQKEKLSFNFLPRIPCDAASEALPCGHTPHGTPRGSPRDSSPCSRYNGPHSPLPGTPQAPRANTPGTVATPASTVNTPLAVSTPRPTPTAPATPATPATPQDATTPDVTPDPAPSTPGDTTADLTSNTDLTATTTQDLTATPGLFSTPGEPASTPAGILSTPAGLPDGAGGGGIQSLPHKELLERLHQTAEALPIPGEYKTGWWHVGAMDRLKALLGALNERGVRERELKRFIEKNFSIVKNAISKRNSKGSLTLVAPIDTEATNLDTDPEEAARVVYDEFGTPVMDEPQHWLPDVALKVDFAVLESVYAMEEKITNASMQNKVRHWLRLWLSAAVARVFSSAGAILRAKRSSLTASNFEELVFLRGNLEVLGFKEEQDQEMEQQED
ncbi:Bromodomain adjacent to zinc finger domain protein 2B [Chionoecetes opilio]|uniref:Bromodomain adjacent to zinc finger domain protein 2B n=1 Tax=Chionoecetes opilio TaxID=41210 RepID=A0A8J4Y6U0_CHIOP|nr:Bromodomain adjacent to zinc finger domain protein 2B [Chionoecetes opilio]